MTFPGLEMTILKFHDFSRFSMTVRTLHYLLQKKKSLELLQGTFILHRFWLIGGSPVGAGDPVEVWA